MRPLIILIFFVTTYAEAARKYVTLSSIRDSDFVQNSKLFSSGWATFAIENFKDRRNRSWQLQIVENKNNPNGPTWFVPHDNENDAFRAGVYAIKKYGGRLLLLNCQERRTCRGIDPNRHFVKRNHIYVAKILDYFRNPNYPVLTLHNNHDRHYSRGGKGVISAKIKRPYKGALAQHNFGDEDDLVVFAGAFKHTTSAAFSKYAPLFNRLNMNHIYEHIRIGGTLRGHMSSYVISRTRMDYMNIEAQFGHYNQQVQYIDKLMSFLAPAKNQNPGEIAAQKTE